MGGNRGATRTASVEMRGYLRTAAAAAAAQSSGKRAEASFSRHLQARCTISRCLLTNAGDKMLDSTEIAPLLMRIEAWRPENPASNKSVRF